MKLNEELSRIKGLMKVLELNESDDKLVNRFQKIIDEVITSTSKLCKTQDQYMDFADFSVNNEWLTPSTCDIIDTIKEFKIVSIKNVTGEAEYYTSKKIPTFSVNVKIVSTDKRIHSYYSDLIEDIEVIIRRKYMVQLLIDDVDINKIPETTHK